MMGTFERLVRLLSLMTIAGSLTLLITIALVK
jgi:hypothetical protein